MTDTFLAWRQVFGEEEPLIKILKKSSTIRGNKIKFMKGYNFVLSPLTTEESLLVAWYQRYALQLRAERNKNNPEVLPSDLISFIRRNLWAESGAGRSELAELRQRPIKDMDDDQISILFYSLHLNEGCTFNTMEKALPFSNLYRLELIPDADPS